MNKKIVAADVKAVETDNPNGEFLVTLSVPSLDRDQEIVDAGAFDPLPDHIPFDIDHGLSTATTVGSGKPYYDGDRLMVRGTFASTPLGQQVRTLVNEGHIRTTSVAMHRPRVETKDGVPHIVKAELLNGAFVPVPANRDALVVASKAEGSCPFCGTKNTPYVSATWPTTVTTTTSTIELAADTQKSVDGEDAPGADPAVKSNREDASGAGGDDEQQHLELRAYALRLLADSVT